jgi:hypothetical protein
MSESQAKRAQSAERELLYLAAAVVDYFGEIEPVLDRDITLRNHAKRILEAKGSGGSLATLPSSGQASHLPPTTSADPARWYCPYCGKDRPSFNFQLVGQAVIGIGALQYFNIFCAEENCRKLLSVAMIGFVPEAQLLEQARQQMRSKVGVA